MRMRVMILCWVVLFGGFVISSCSSSSNMELFIAFLSYEENTQNNEYTQSQLGFDVVVGGKDGARQHLATGTLIPEWSKGGSRYIDVEDFTRPLWFDLGDRRLPVEISLSMSIYRNMTTEGNAPTGDVSSLKVLDELAHVLDIKMASDYFSTLVIYGKQRPNATLQLAVRLTCKGIDCGGECTEKPWLQHCKDVGKQDSLLGKYAGNPLARCPSPAILPPIKPQSSIIVTLPTTYSTTKPSGSTATSSKSVTPSPSSDTLSTTMSQTDEKTSSTEKYPSTKSLQPSSTESSLPMSPTKSSSYVPNTQTTLFESSSIWTTTQVINTQTQTSTVTTSQYTSTASVAPSIQTETISSKPTISTTSSHQTKSISSTQSEIESSTNHNVQTTTSITISPTSTRRSCRCTQTKSMLSKSTISSTNQIDLTSTENIPTSSMTVMTSFPSSSTSHPSANTPYSSTPRHLQPTPTITTLLASTITSTTTSTISPSPHSTNIIPSTTIQDTTSASHSLTPTSTTTNSIKDTTSVTPRTTDNAKSTTPSPDTTNADRSSSPTTPPNTRPTNTDKPSSPTTSDNPSATGTTRSPFLPVESPSDDDDDPMAYWAIIVGSVIGGLALVGLFGYLLYRSRQTSLRKRQELYTVTPQIISTIEENGMAGRSDVPMTTALL